MLAAFALGACQHDVIYEVDYNVTLDKGNTYYAGEPVKFNVSGEVDNILFYSGETGHTYKFKDRFHVDSDQIKSADLKLEVLANYGTDYGSLEVWVTDQFEGLTGTDGGKDKAAIEKMVKEGMPGWTKLEYRDEKANNNKWVEFEFPLNDYMDNMTLAFHWCPPTHERTQRTYWIKGAVNIEMEGVQPISQTLRELGCVKIMMNEEEAPLHNPENKAGNGTMRLPQPDKDGNWPEQHIIMQGVGANGRDYALDGWILTTPQPLNKVANDKGVVIKNLQNYLHTYEYTWNEPGTYEVVFVGRNENYASASEQVIKYKITIMERVDE